jgi:hypothetical protein
MNRLGWSALLCLSLSACRSGPQLATPPSAGTGTAATAGAKPRSSTPPAGSSTAALPSAEPRGFWQRRPSQTGWTKSFAPSAGGAMCPHVRTVSEDGGLYATGHFLGTIRMDGVRLTSDSPAMFLARFDARGRTRWATVLPKVGSVSQVRVFGQHVQLGAMLLDRSMARISYATDGKLESILPLGEPAWVHLLDATSWVTVGSVPERRNTALEYVDEAGRQWRLHLDAGGYRPPTSDRDGRIAVQGDVSPSADWSADPDLVSVVERSAGRLLFQVPIPRGAATNTLEFDRAGRLWIVGYSAGTHDDFLAGRRPTPRAGTNAFILLIDRDGKPLHWLWAKSTEQVWLQGFAPSPDGSILFSYRATSTSRVESSFAKPFTLEAIDALLEVNPSTSELTFHSSPPFSHAASFLAERSVLVEVSHYANGVYRGQPERCELTQLLLTPP